MYIPNVPFAHTIEPISVDLIEEFVSADEWRNKRFELRTLARFPHPLGGGTSYYVVFLDPSNRTLDFIINANLLYKLFNHEFWNEEIHLITPKK